MKRPRFIPDNFTLILIGLVVLASVLPVSGDAAVAADWLTNLAIALLFFLHGAKLPTQAVVAGLAHWRLHGLVFACTFLLFPAIGLALRPVLEPAIGPDLYRGMLFLCALPATVQSAIAFTSIARGNVAAAICSAATSSLVGIFVTPLLVLLMLGAAVQSMPLGEAIGKITVQLMVPFLAGQLSRRWIGSWVETNKAWLKYVDQGSIYLVIYTAFSRAVVEGIWNTLPLWQLASLTVACCVLLAVILVMVNFIARRLRFSVEDRITILFAGSKKSLASGVPMAQVLFSGAAMGTLLLPLMLFHQIQLMVCAVLAKRYARRPETP
ncbi:bile acid:sodium symporter [Yanghanlia caeni]|uniref:Bile acid:sodium symporter family protein n=1 Tax=Yanghanlia caeni TaxID=3064283 RepID=A0ABU1D2A9_9BURK|nr:bile acid:sodium symporter family protein [Alcaligenaceae bacterium LG-2]NGR07803.1 bile acid:sodium symporter [bacterium SGD-2]HZH57322.1 bile acid:sodium symporter family protein [Burkholderiaceae bacterium]